MPRKLVDHATPRAVMPAIVHPIGPDIAARIAPIAENHAMIDGSINHIHVATANNHENTVATVNKTAESVWFCETKFPTAVTTDIRTEENVFIVGMSADHRDIISSSIVPDNCSKIPLRLSILTAAFSAAFVDSIDWESLLNSSAVIFAIHAAARSESVQNIVDRYRFFCWSDSHTVASWSN